MSATVTATATLPALVFSSGSSSSASSSDEAHSRTPLALLLSNYSAGLHSVAQGVSQHSNTVAEMNLDDASCLPDVDVISQRPHKLRKPTRPPPTSFRTSPSFMPTPGSDLNLYLSPMASSSQIARTTAIVQDKLSMEAGSYARMSSKTSTSHASSNASGTPSSSRSTSTTSPAPSTRKLSKRRPDSPPPIHTKSKSMRRNFKLKSPSLTNNPVQVSLYSDSLPPLLSTSPIPWKSQETSSPPALSPPPKISPLDLHEFYFDVHEFGSDNGVDESGSPVSERKKGLKPNLMRRWSHLEIPDEVLAVELDEMRRVNRIKERKRSNRAQSENHNHSSFQTQDVPSPYSPGAFVYGGPPSGHRFWVGDYDDVSDDDESDVGSEDGWKEDSMMDQEEEDWKKTRRALFCCRELIRTEKSYSVRLLQLLDGNTLTPPPTLLTTYLPALIVASNTLLDNFAQDPTAYGVSKAFTDIEFMLENALVSYCGVVGDVFMNRSEKRKLVRPPRRNSMIDVRNKGRLVEGGTGESMRDSRFVIKEELSKPPVHLSEVHRNTAPPVLESMGGSVVDVGLEYDSQSPSDTLGKDKRRGGALRRTMSLFKRDGYKKRKSLPPLPSQTDIGAPRSLTPNPHPSPNVFYSETVARASSLISLAFGLTPSPPPAPPPKPLPPPLPPKDVRQHTKSAPTPSSKASIDPQTYDFPTGPTSSISHVGSSSTHGHGYGVISNSGHDEKPEKIPTVRDLAIQPTQRAMRYVLLYRDLLDHTPLNSPTRPLVERALEGAVRIADKCNRAQGNAAFLRRA